jgi:glycosyltransferase involved in cell wall biosynthesis
MKKLTITFDDIIYNLQKNGGVSVYWQELTARLERSANISRIGGGKYSRMIPQYAQTDIFHSSHFRFAWNKGVKNVSTVHDMTYELGMVNGKGVLPNVLERKISYFTADALICISENTKKDLLDVYPTLAARCPIHVVYHGSSLSAADAVPDARFHEKFCSKKYVLYVGGRGGYKNFDAALLGFQLSRLHLEGYSLLCAGKPFNNEELARIAALGLNDAVRAVANVSSSQLIQLYRSAFCMVYPSKYEGFGLPPIEAMNFSCPVIASNRSSIPEVVGQAAWLIDPDNPSEIADALIGLTDDVVREALVRNGLLQASTFSWDISAQKHLEIYQSLFE